MNFWLRRVVALVWMFALCLPGVLSAQTAQTESVGGREAVAGEVIVRFRAGPSAAQSPDIITAKTLTPSRIALLKSSGRTVPELLREYSNRADVVYAEPNYIWRKNDVTNDPYLNMQWALRNTGQSVLSIPGAPGADIRAVQAWDLAQGSRSFVIGIVDSGVDYNHPDLAANIWTAPRDFTVTVGGQSITCFAGSHGFDAITRTCDPIDDDANKHGTIVAGVIGADGDNSLGISGVSRVASMMPLKFLGPNGTGNTADAIAAIQFAIQAKAVLGGDANIRILNSSWGSSSFSLALLDVINAAGSSDMLVVAAAGNESANTDVTPHYPSSYNASNILSVAATNSRDLLYEFSNFGVNSVDLGAPGENVAATLPPATYMHETGTSLAAAVVSGGAGLVLSGCSTLTTAQLRSTLLGAVDTLPSLQSRTASGGRLNVYRALVNCAGAAPPVFSLKSLSPVVLPGLDGSTTATITMSGMNGYSSDVTLAASAPAGVGVFLSSSVLTTSESSATLTVTTDSSIAPGLYVIHVTGTGGGVERTAGLALIVGSPISNGQNIEQSWSLQTSQPNRFVDIIPPQLADWYQIAVNSTTTLTISLLASNQQGNYLRLLNSSGNVVAATNASSNNILLLSQTVGPGVYGIVASTGSNGSSSPRGYSLAVNAPHLRLVNPSDGDQGEAVNVTLSGAQFAPGLTIDVTNDISVSNVVFTSTESATARFSISPDAPVGPRTVRVITNSGTSNGFTFAVQQPRPVLTSVTPSAGVVGTSVDITILGAHFIDPILRVNTGLPAVILDNVVVVSTTMITGRLTIPPNANIQNVSIHVETAGGFQTITFGVLPLPPVLTSVNPASGNLGSVVDVTLTGALFYGPMTVDAGIGITVSNLSIQFGRTTATARFTISPTTTVGMRNVSVTTPGGTSGVLSFMVTPGPGPTLTSISPAIGPQTTTRTYDMRGTNFVTGFTLDAGPDITVTTFSIVSSTQATLTIQVAGGATLGPRNITVTTLGGTSNPLVFTVAPPPPTLTSMSPSSGPQQSSIPLVTFVGTNFVPGMTFQAGPLGITQLAVISSTTATAGLTIPVSTLTGNHNVSVVTPSGTSAPVTFTVLPGIPTLTAIQPNYGIRWGQSTSVSISGTNFATGNTTISQIPGVYMLQQVVSGSGIQASFSIGPTAPLGTHNLTLTTPGGTTGSVPFTIYDPFPDLSVGASSAFPLWRGLNSTFMINMANYIWAPAKDPIIITDLLPPELTFVSGGGNGFSCSASGQLVSCTYENLPFPLWASTFTTITVAVSPSAPPTLTHTISLPYAADLFPENNTYVAKFSTLPFPTPLFTFTPTTLTGGQQATVALTLPTPVPYNITGTLTLSFASAATPPLDDPAIRFLTGGRQVSFSFQPNALQAVFANGLSPGPITYQTGTLAGSISFSGIAKVDLIQQPFASPPGSTSLNIPASPPVIQNVRKVSQGGFAVLITSSSTSRSMTDLTLEFNTTPAIQVSCGSVSGCTASGSSLTLDVRTLYDNWFAAGTQFGSLNTLRLPLNIQGAVQGAVNVMLKNALGSSNVLSFTLP